MKVVLMTLLLAGLGLQMAYADSPCSTKAMAGHWAYASSPAQALPDPTQPPLSFASIGIVNVDRYGNISGKYDVVALGLPFQPDVTFIGSITVNPDCTGTVYYLASNGFEELTSIVVVDRKTILGMTQGQGIGAGVLTYQLRRISSKSEDDDDDSD